MKLKKLEITGFKSFYEKSAIEFISGIAGIVGPNGCGKSNVVDALRWVMGEQSAKKLRGKAMADIIFAGTDGKSPLNMAEVSLVLNNADGTAPEPFQDYAEIMVTRRLYRSGESAYLINRQPCRLKDIIGIFTDSGLGAKSYAVIQQGNVGAITEAGPEERRFFIEEAAGVTRYKGRKTETLRKIKATDENLTRVTDIITEIKRQMSGLKRQVRKAERFHKLRIKIRRIDIVLSLHYYDEYTQRIQAVDQILARLKNTDMGNQAELKTLEAAIAESEFMAAEKNKHITDQKTVLHETQRTIDKTENNILHLLQESERLKQEIKSLQKTQADLTQKNEDLNAEVKTLEQLHTDMQASVIAKKDVIAQEERDSQATGAEIAALDKQSDTLQADLMNQVALEARNLNAYQAAVKNRENLQRRLKRLDETEAMAARQTTQLQNEASSLGSETEDLTRTINNIDMQLDALNETLFEKRFRVSEQEELIMKFKLELNQVSSAHDALKKMDADYQWYESGVKAIMQKRKAERKDTDAKPDDGIIGLVADVIRPVTSCETAVQALLDDALQYIIITDHQKSTESLNYLQQHQTGRCGFIPTAATVRKESGLTTRRTPDSLLNHIAVKPGFEKVVETLVGDAVIADDITDAMQKWEQSDGRQTVVAKTGDLITGSGIMIGGGRENIPSILSKKNEIRQLAGRMAEISSQSDRELEILRTLESELHQTEDELAEQDEYKQSCQEERNELEKERYKAEESLKHARRQLDMTRSEQEQLHDETDTAEDEMKQYTQAVTDTKQRIEMLRSQIDTVEQQRNDVSAVMQRFIDRIVELKLELTDLNARRDSSEKNLQRILNFRDDSLRHAEQLNRDIILKLRKREDAKLRSAEYDQSLASLHRDMENQQQTLASSETAYQKIEVERVAKARLITDLQKRRELNIQQIHTRDAELTRHQIEMDNIAKRLEERYDQSVEQLRTELHRQADIPDTPSDESELESMETELSRYRKQLAAMGDVNQGAVKEYEELEKRYDFIKKQHDDLVQAIEDLRKVIRKIDRITRERFIQTFEAVNVKLSEVFPRLFEGGSAKLIMTEPNRPLETGVEFLVHPPGKKLTRLTLLSGGEKALSAIAFIFAIFLLKPTSFCIMDEIDAPLDEANTFRFNQLLKIIGEKTQVIMITHNKQSMQLADILYGVTMENQGVSKIVSVRFEN
ncbi:chromosome segregation protein SMC [Desulfococcaceae bacterium HSG9]|nr:chromosome segregation protein SMC [Desulfococcaceae bacterium HSG9]